MPIYEYECSECGIHFERFQRVGDKPADVCPEGHGGVRRIYSPAGIIFKGAGFYITDNRRNNGGGRKRSPAAKKSATEDAVATEEKASEKPGAKSSEPATSSAEAGGRHAEAVERHAEAGQA